MARFPTIPPMERLEDTDLWHVTVELPRGARVEFRLEVTGRDRTDRMLDPLNKRTASDPFGSNSVADPPATSSPPGSRQTPTHQGHPGGSPVEGPAFGDDRLALVPASRAPEAGRTWWCAPRRRRHGRVRLTGHRARHLIGPGSMRPSWSPCSTRSIAASCPPRPRTRPFRGRRVAAPARGGVRRLRHPAAPAVGGAAWAWPAWPRRAPPGRVRLAVLLSGSFVTPWVARSTAAPV